MSNKQTMACASALALAGIVGVASASAEQAFDPEAPPNHQFESIGCNVLTVGSQTIDWTSAFGTDDYELNTILRVTVTWDGSVCPTPDSTSPNCGAMPKGISVRQRGGGFSPGGVTGTLYQPPVEITDGSLTFDIAFTNLHTKGNSGASKGNAQLLVDVQVDQDCDGNLDMRGETPVTTALGVNVHAQTAPDEP